jgi:hypothetical protein
MHILLHDQEHWTVEWKGLETLKIYGLLKYVTFALMLTLENK